MAYRFFLPGFVTADAELSLEGAEHHHLAHVLRLKAGATVELFDGEGRSADAEVVSIAKSRAVVRVITVREDAAIIRGRVSLLTAVPKADRFRWLVEKATELGVEKLVPLQATRSVVDPGLGKIERMNHAVIEACKQSGRNRLMRIGAPISFAHAIETCAPDETWLADPTGVPVTHAQRRREPDRPIAIMIGPEGGWTPEELTAAERAGVTRVSLGTPILRIETAAIALAAVAIAK